MPEEADLSVLPDLLVFGDGSEQAFCALAYARWKLVDGSYNCVLISGKTRVAPLTKISIPRMELMGAVAAARLAANIEEAMKPNIVFKQRFFFTDNTSVLAMIKGDSAAFKEFVGTRVGEIKNKTKPEEEWMWIPTHDNLSDMGTRDDTIPQHLRLGTEYQTGKQWMREEKHLWPAKTSGGTVPEDEVKLAARLVNTLSTSDGLDFQYEKYSDVGKLKRVVMIVFKAFFIFKQKLVRNKHILIPNRNELAQQADNFLMVRSQSSIKEDLEKEKLTQDNTLTTDKYQELDN